MLFGAEFHKIILRHVNIILRHGIVINIISFHAVVFYEIMKKLKGAIICSDAGIVGIQPYSFIPESARRIYYSCGLDV